jgi:predicted RND superfamily exporter protein
MHQIAMYWGDRVVSLRLWILIFSAILICAGILVSSIFKPIRHDNSIEAYFLDDDPHLINYDHMVELFDDNEFLIIGVPAHTNDTDVLNVDTLHVIEEISVFLEEHEQVNLIRSLTRYQFLHDDNGLLGVNGLFDDLDNVGSNPETLRNIRNTLLSEELALGILVTKDLKHARITARIESIKNENAHKVQLVSDIRDFIKTKGYQDRGFDIKLSGVPVIAERFETVTKRDRSLLNPTMGIVMVIALFVIFRSWCAVFAVLFSVLASVSIVLCTQALLGFPNTTVNTALTPLIVILCTGASVHLLVEYSSARREGLDKLSAAKKISSDLFFPILLTSATTAFGFLALAITELVPVRQFSLIAALGAMVIFIICTTATPALIAILPWNPKNKRSKTDQFLAKKLPALTYKYRKPLWITGIIFSLCSVYGVSFIQVNTDIIAYFKKDSWVSEDLRYFNKNFKGINSIEMIIDAKKDSGIKNPQFLTRVERLQASIESFDETGEVLSIIDFLKKVNQALHNDNPDYYTLPDSSALSAQLLLQYEVSGPNEDLSDLKDFNERYLRLSIPILHMNQIELSDFLQRFNLMLNKQYRDLDIEITGSGILKNAQDRYVNNGMVKSFTIAIFVIGASFLFLFGSLKHGLIALVPSVVPILATGAIAALSGLHLDLGTMIVGATTLGIAVDDSVHVMSRYRLLKHRGKTTIDAIMGALSSSGKAVIFSSIILVLGFGVMLFGQFVPYVYFGLFSASIMIFALIGDLLFLPALLHFFDHEPELKSDAKEISYV